MKPRWSALSPESLKTTRNQHQHCTLRQDLCEYGSRCDIWHDIHKYTVYIEVKRRQRQKRETERGEGRAERDVSLEWAEENRCSASEKEVGDAVPSLRKRFQDGVHLLCHGCQRKLKLLLRRWKRKFKVSKQLRNAFSE